MKPVPYLYLLALCALLSAGPAGRAGVRTPSATASPDTRSVGLLHREAYTPLQDREAMLDAYYGLIKDLPFDYGKVGSIVEALAFKHFEVIYPPDQFKIVCNLTYQDARGRTLGELDLAVFEKHTGDAVLVVEAKSGRRIRHAGHQATAQLERFQRHIKAGEVAGFSASVPLQEPIEPAQFKEDAIYARVGGQGALSAGFEFEVDLTREEAGRLQDRLHRQAQVATRPPDNRVRAVPEFH